MTASPDMLFRSSVTDVSTVQKDILGAERYEKDPTTGHIFRFRYVKYSGSTVLYAGNVVGHDIDITDTDDIFTEVVLPVTDSLSLLGGVVMATTVPDSSTDARYFWVMTEGISDAYVYQFTQTTTIAKANYLKGVNGQAYLTNDAATQPLYKRTIQVLTNVPTSTTAGAYKHACLISCI